MFSAGRVEPECGLNVVPVVERGRATKRRPGSANPGPPPGGPPAPPLVVVPYKVPAASATSPACGMSPSRPPVNAWSGVSVLRSAESLNTAPRKAPLPPNSSAPPLVVPNKLPAASIRRVPCGTAPFGSFVPKLASVTSLRWLGPASSNIVPPVPGPPYCVVP